MILENLQVDLTKGGIGKGRTGKHRIRELS